MVLRGELRQGFYDLKCGLHRLHEKNVVREQYACEPQQELSSAERMSCTQPIVTGAARSSLQPQTRGLAMHDGLSGVFTLQPQTEVRLPLILLPHAANNQDGGNHRPGQRQASTKQRCWGRARWCTTTPIGQCKSSIPNHAQRRCQNSHTSERRECEISDLTTHLLSPNHRRRAQRLGPNYFRYRTVKSRQTRILRQLRSPLPY